MRWIALLWRLEARPLVPGEKARDILLPPREALGWWALQFTPRAVWIDEALLIEVSTCERLWGGPRALLAELMARNPAPEATLLRAQGDSSLAALARLRLIMVGQRPPADIPAALPLRTLTAARPHLEMLERLGCRRWGDVEKLPRAGLARRFGAPLREALDLAWCRRPEVHPWLQLPESFDQKVELPALAERAPELLWSAGRLLKSLQIWLRARQRGVLALELQWKLDLKRIDGVDLPPFESLLLRTAEPVQGMDHLQRLLGEKLAQQKMAAPASGLRLITLETASWGGASASFLPEDNRRGDALHELVERLSARLGEDRVLAAVPQADHRPETMQQWQPARAHLRSLAAPGRSARTARADKAATTRAASGPPALQADALYPGWLLSDPLPLDTRQGVPLWRGPLRTVAGPHRLETGWWTSPEGAAPQRALRDYYIAESPGAGLVWIFQERPRKPAGTEEAGTTAAPASTSEPAAAQASAPAPAPVSSPSPAPEPGPWFLHGLYA